MIKCKRQKNKINKTFSIWSTFCFYRIVAFIIKKAPRAKVKQFFLTHVSFLPEKGKQQHTNRQWNCVSIGYYNANVSEIYV